MANKKKCLICGGLYNYCNTCYEDRFKPGWYQVFCSEECKEIDGILSANTVGEMTDIEAKHELEKLNLSGKVFNKQKVKDKITYFLNLEEPEEELEKVEDSKDEENTTEDLAELENENNDGGKSKYRKNKYSKNR